MRLFILATLLGLMVTGSAAAADRFVNNQIGDNRNDSLSEGRTSRLHGPVRTINRALALANKGDRIVIANTGEPYRESISLSDVGHSGTAFTPFIIQGNGAILDGTVRVPAGAWERFDKDVFRCTPPRLAFQQLFLNGKPLKRRLIDTQEARLPKLETLEWCQHAGSIYLRVEENQLPGDYPLAFAGHQVGITLYQVHDVVVTDLIVQGFQLDGINAHDLVDKCRLINITARGNGRSGIAVAGTSRVTIENGLLGDNGAAQLFTDQLSSVWLQETELLENTAPAMDRQGGRVFVNDQEIE